MNAVLSFLIFKHPDMKKIIAAGGLVENENGELLMIFRRGKWDLPKGKMDNGETPESCALREVVEETGLQEITLGKFIGTTTHQYFDQWISEGVIKETYWYKMSIKNDPELIPQTEEDITEIKWVNKKQLSEYLSNTYNNIVEIISKSGFNTHA